MIDPITKQPVAYAKTANGFLLYSFGFNGQDEQACSEREKQYRGVPATQARLLLSEPELVALEQLLNSARTEWTDEQVESLAVGDDLATRSPLFVPAVEKQ